MALPFIDSVLQQTRNHLLDQSDLNEAQRAAVKEVEKRVDALQADYAKEKGLIENDGDRSVQGREKDLATLKQDFAARLQRITDSEVSQIATRLAELEVQLQPQPPATDPVVQELREQEIRSLLRDKPELMIIADYQAWAVEGGNDLAMQAIENSPAFAPLIGDPSILEAGKRGRAARQSPEAAALLKQLRQRQALLRNIVQSAQAQIGLPADDPIALIAAGKAG